jgi:hypothetical protein
MDIPYFKTFTIFKPLKKLPGTVYNTSMADFCQIAPSKALGVL